MATIYGNRWKIESSLGEGGQAHAFLVTDEATSDETRYVLKRLKNVDRLGRFRKEIEAVKTLKHENVVRLIDYDLDAEKPYLVTEYCAAGSLDQSKPFWQSSPTLALRVFEQICRGVAHAHAQGVVHRDLKPANIFLREEEGPAVVGDFGICYIETDGERLTSTQEAVGPRNFTAPELEHGRLDQVSDRSDVYSLGKILYWLFCGKVLFRERHREREWDLRQWDPVQRRWQDIYKEHVNRMLDAMLDAHPENRPQIDSVLADIPRVTRLIAKEYSPIAADIPRPPCVYCGEGIYELRVANQQQVRSFGITPTEANFWRIMVCTHCGHVQMFRIERAIHRDDWWKPRGTDLGDLDPRSTGANLLELIRFSPNGSLTDDGWYTPDPDGPNITLPKYQAIVDQPFSDAVRIESDFRRALDRDVEPTAQAGSLLRFLLRYEQRSILYARLRVGKTETDDSKEVWLSFPDEEGPPERTSLNEWSYPAKPRRLEDNWIDITVDLREAVEMTYSREGWQYEKLLGFRIRGTISLGYLAVYRW